MTFQLIETERAHHAVSRLCSVLDVSRQGYWAWKHRPLSRRRVEDARLKPLIRQAWRASDETYGAPRLHTEVTFGYLSGRHCCLSRLRRRLHDGTIRLW